MSLAAVPLDSRAHRMALVAEHVRCENAHDLPSVIQTFGDSARYDDEPWDAHYEGREEVVIRGTQCGPWRGLPATGRRVGIPRCGVYIFSADDHLAEREFITTVLWCCGS